MKNELKNVGIIDEIMSAEDLLNEELAQIKGGSIPDRPTGCTNGANCSNGSGCGNGITDKLTPW